MWEIIHLTWGQSASWGNNSYDELNIKVFEVLQHILYICVTAQSQETFQERLLFPIAMIAVPKKYLKYL